jgi:hypothetical protein
MAVSKKWLDNNTAAEPRPMRQSAFLAELTKVGEFDLGPIRQR